MSLPTGRIGRPLTPAPGVPVEERRIAQVRRHARHFVWAALVLIAVAAAVGYLYGNLPDPYENWMLLAAAALVIFLLGFLPFLAWRSHTFTITTRRVIERSGVFGTRRREFDHMRGYTINLRRGPLQRMWGTGTLVLTDPGDAPMRLVDIPGAVLVHEVLVDQVEVNQILAHRDAQSPLPPGTPPVPPLPQR